MIISRFGIELRSLDKTYLQDLREWRNREETRNYMAYQKTIDAEAQHIWYDQMDHTKNLLFTYHFDGDVHGFVQLKDIDLSKGHAESGVIHGNTETKNSTVSLIAIIVLMEVAFDLVGLQTLRAKIKHDNERVISMNTNLGYKRIHHSHNETFPYFQVDKLRFDKHTVRFRNMLTRRHGAHTNLKINPSDTYWANRFQDPSKFEFIDINSFESTV